MRSPEGSFHGMPVSCTRRPGAWPTIISRAVRPARNIGLGGNGRCSAHTSQARTSRSNIFSALSFDFTFHGHDTRFTHFFGYQVVVHALPGDAPRVHSLRGMQGEQHKIRLRIGIVLMASASARVACAGLQDLPETFWPAPGITVVQQADYGVRTQFPGAV